MPYVISLPLGWSISSWSFTVSSSNTKQTLLQYGSDRKKSLLAMLLSLFLFCFLFSGLFVEVVVRSFFIRYGNEGSTL